MPRPAGSWIAPRRCGASEWLCRTRILPTLQPPDPRGSTGKMNEEIDPRVWRRVYVATLAYGVVTIAVLWWFTAVFD
jgi:hypothetical protein